MQQENYTSSQSFAQQTAMLLLRVCQMVMLWSAEEMLDGQYEKVNVSAHAKTAYDGLPRERLEEDLCWILPHVPLTTQLVKEMNWTKAKIVFTMGAAAVYRQTLLSVYATS